MGQRTICANRLHAIRLDPPDDLLKVHRFGWPRQSRLYDLKQYSRALPVRFRRKATRVSHISPLAQALPNLG
jgi:hypothetical protein